MTKKEDVHMTKTRPSLDSQIMVVYPGLFSVGFWLVIVWHPGMIMSLGVFMHPKRRRPRELGPKGVQSDGQSLDGDI